MSHGNCPKCEEKIEPYDASLVLFPFFWVCSNCHVRLRLKSHRILALTFIIHLAVMLTLMATVRFPFSMEVILLIGIPSWFVVFKRVAGKIFNKENLYAVEPV